jgi:hypothetical protein
MPFSIIAICLIGGVVAGIHLNAFWETVVGIICVAFLFTNWVSDLEIGALAIVAMVMLFIVGIIIGDVYVYFVFEQGSIDRVLKDMIKFFFVPSKYQ